MRSLFLVFFLFFPELSSADTLTCGCVTYTFASYKLVSCSVYKDVTVRDEAHAAASSDSEARIVS
jgi:hypothetical protein